jgi:hypothetical protein
MGAGAEFTTRSAAFVALFTSAVAVGTCVERLAITIVSDNGLAVTAVDALAAFRSASFATSVSRSALACGDEELVVGGTPSDTAADVRIAGLVRVAPALI